MSDLVERLRNEAVAQQGETEFYEGLLPAIMSYDESRMLWEAAARIEALEAEVQRLREALRPFVAKSAVSYAAISHMPDELPDYAEAISEITAGDIRRARAAMEPTND